MENKILIAMLIMAIPVIFAGCGYTQTVQCDETNTADISSASVISDIKTSDSDSAGTTAVTSDSEITAEKETGKTETAPYTHSRSEEANIVSQAQSKPINSASTEKAIETTAQILNPTETTTKSKPPETTIKSTPTTEPQKEFDINCWLEFAKGYAKSVGLQLERSAADCWDNPIAANAKCKYLERDIKSRLNRYAKDEDITDVWIWAEKVADNSYEIYIGYA